MKMKKILNEWRVFLKENKFEKTPLEQEIEAVFERDQKGKKLSNKEKKEASDLMVNVKAAAHAVEFLRGRKLAGQENYLNRIQFGMSNADRIIMILRNPTLFSQYFDIGTKERPPEDKRFPETSKKTFKAVEMTDIWTKQNLQRQLNPSVKAFGANEENAYQELFGRIGAFEAMLEAEDYEFTKRLGRTKQWRTLDDRHTGGPAPTGLIVTPEEATDEDKAYIGERFTFYMKHRSSPAFPMAKLAEEKFQEALKKALGLWKQFPFKDGEEKQAFTGAVIRMEDALRQSEEDLAKIMSDTSAYSQHNKPATKEEDVEALIVKAEAGDKEAASKAYEILKKAGDKRSRKMRQLMR